MRRSTLFLLLAVAGLMAGCSLFPHKQKSVTHIYSGDSPSTKMEGTQSAGGELQTY
jgi:hypothetical protein